jgi:hypothetical protein
MNCPYNYGLLRRFRLQGVRQDRTLGPVRADLIAVCGGGQRRRTP